MEKFSEEKIKRVIISFIFAYLNAMAMQYVTSISGDTGTWMGTQIYSFMPESVLWLLLCYILVYRFLERKILKKRGVIILSIIFGFALGFMTVWCQEVLYNTTLFNDSVRVLKAFIASLGLMIFTVPFVSELTLFFDKVSEYSANTTDAARKKVFRFKYFFVTWIIFFASYVPMFLWAYPINIYGDAIDALNNDYLLGHAGTHHTPVHWIILGKFYDLGVRHGKPSYGLKFFTLLQMLIMSGAIAYFLFYIYKRKVNPIIRRIIFAVFLINPLHSYYAVTAEKGTIGVCFALVAMTLLCEIFDLVRADKKKSFLKQPKLYIRSVLFVVFFSLGSLFRNNMIYAVIAGGVIIIILSKGWKKKLLFLIIFVLTFSLYKIEYNGLVKAYGLTSNDKYRETFAVPIICLARVAVYHADEMPPELLSDIVSFIPPDALESYNIADDIEVKYHSNEYLLGEQTKRFLMLFIKCGFKYPADYMDQMGWMITGYFNPLYAHVLSGTTSVGYKPLEERFMQIDHEDILKSKFYEWMYWNDGRYMMPLISLFIRPFLYTWFTLYAFAYGIYKKDKRRIALSLIPLMYFGTTLLGPACILRYIYFNALLLGFELYLIFADSSPDLTKHSSI